MMDDKEYPIIPTNALFVSSANAELARIQGEINTLNAKVDSLDRMHRRDFQEVTAAAAESRARINEAIKESTSDIKSAKKDIRELNSLVQNGLAKMELNLLNSVDQVKENLMEYINKIFEDYRKEGSSRVEEAAEKERLKIESKVFRFFAATIGVSLVAAVVGLMFKYIAGGH